MKNIAEMQVLSSGGGVLQNGGEAETEEPEENEFLDFQFWSLYHSHHIGGRWKSARAGKRCGKAGRSAERGEAFVWELRSLQRTDLWE